MTAPRVLFVNHTGTMSGAEAVLAEVAALWPGAAALIYENGPLVAALTGRGLDVAVAEGGADLAGIRRDGSLWRSLPLAGRMLRLLVATARHARRADLVYANSQKAFTLAALACAVVRRPLIWHLHDILSPAHFSPAQRRLQIGLADRLATRVIVPSRATADAFVAAGGRADLVRVVANGVASPAAEPALAAPFEPPASPRIGVFSRLAPWKGQHVVIDALAELPGVGAVIAGAPLFGEDAYAERLSRMVADRGLADRVRFLGQRSDVAALMRRVDVVVHPSVDPEPFGLTLIEAMIARTPVIATDAGAAADILDGGRCGVLVPPGDAGALAAAIRTTLARPADLAARIDRAHERAATEYGLERMRAAVAEVIFDVAGRVR